MGTLQPSARQFALGKIFRELPLALTYRSDRNIGADIFERHEPIGVVLVNFSEQVQDGRSHNEKSAGSGSLT